MGPRDGTVWGSVPVLDIVEYPNDMLIGSTELISTFDHSLKDLVESMTERMYLSNGVGLAAPQVGVTRKVVLIDPSAGDEANQLTAMVNPRVTWRSEEVTPDDEGCLSLPGVTVKVFRSLAVNVEYYDVEGVMHSVKCTGFKARIAQHEIDHLDGIMMIDRVGHLSRMQALKHIGKNR